MNVKLRDITKSLSLTVLSFFLVAGVLYSATTIGSNITTAGTLSVTDTSTLTGAVTTGAALTVGTTLTVTGNTTLANASSTVLTVSGASYLVGNTSFNGFATTTASTGAFATAGHSTLTTASTTALSVDNTLGVASSTLAAELGVVGDGHFGSAATTTLTLSSSRAVTGGCLELEGANGTMFKIYATTTGPLIATSGTCQ